MDEAEPMDEVEAAKAAALAEAAAASTSAELRQAQGRALGRAGSIPALMRGLAALGEPEARRARGRAANGARAQVEAAFEARGAELRARELAARLEAERIDPTMPGRPARAGLEHVLQQTANKIKRVLGGLGFEYREGPEVERTRYNFSALNYPPDHPAMDDQDTFYIDDDLLLRTQGTALQGRVFETQAPPLRVFTIARTYRNEAVDRTHNHTFHQVDAFMVDEGVSMASLKGTLGLFARAMFGEDVRVRFRPDFFPFVEPGVDYAVSSPRLFGGRWVELGGAGLVHPNVLEAHGVDAERFSGFAFGLGVERIPMMAYGVDDLRPFLENDLRFLEQFRTEMV